MKINYWLSELLTIIIIFFCCLILYKIIGNFSLLVIICLVIYMTFFAFRLHRFLHWLKNGMQQELTPKSYGVIRVIIDLVYQYKKTIEKSDAQQKAMVKQFTNIISTIPCATVILNQDNDIEWANYSALLLLGIDGQQDIGVNIQTLLRQSKFIKQLGKKSSQEFEIISPVNATVTLAVRITEYTHKKRLLLAHNISSNIDSQHSRKTFVANASHELRTPLTVIAGYLEFIQSDPSLPANLYTPVNKALKQSDNMLILIEDLLTLSRLENKKLTKKSLCRINLQEHLNGVLQTLTASGKLEKYKIICDVEENLFIEALPKELDSVCYNLINNALKYSEAGTEIRITWKKNQQNIKQQQAKFSVTDQGIGIAPEHIAHLTERFYRVDNGRSRRVGGTGLGLSIVKHIVERHHGCMEIYSRLGEGSTFSVIFPLHPLQRQTDNV